MAQLFGTDGVRGVANTQLTCDIAYKLGQAAVRYLGSTIAVGKDTRLSGDMLEAALGAGIMSAGGTVLSLGIIPTPGEVAAGCGHAWAAPAGEREGLVCACERLGLAYEDVHEIWMY